MPPVSSSLTRRPRKSQHRLTHPSRRHAPLRPHLGSHAPENRHAGGRQGDRRGARGGRERNRGGEAGSSGRGGGGADAHSSRGVGPSRGGDHGTTGDRKRRGEDRLKLRKKTKSKQGRGGEPRPRSGADAPSVGDRGGGGPTSPRVRPHRGGGGTRAVVRSRERGLPAGRAPGDRAARRGAPGDDIAESLRCHARSLTLLGTVDVRSCVGFHAVTSFVRVDEGVEGDTDAVDGQHPPIHKGSEQFVMVGRTCVQPPGDRARLVSVTRSRGNDRHRGWNASDTTLRMHSVATGYFRSHGGVQNPTVNAAVAPDYLARVWHQRRAEIGEDDQRRPTVFLFGFMHEAEFSLHSYRTRETDIDDIDDIDDSAMSLMPRMDGATMFDFAVSPYTGRVIAATDAGAKVMFDETHFSRGESPSSDWSVKGRSDIVAVAADVDWWNESSGTVGNRAETFILGMRNGGMTLFDIRETGPMRQPFGTASSYVTHMHAMRTCPGQVIVSTADGGLTRWDVRSLRSPVATFREGSPRNFFNTVRRCGVDARESFVGADCGESEPPKKGHPRSGRDVEGVALWDVRTGGEVWRYRREVRRGTGESFSAVHVDVGAVPDSRGWEYEDGPSVRVYAAGGGQLRSFVPTACLGESGHASLDVWLA